MNRLLARLAAIPLYLILHGVWTWACYWTREVRRLWGPLLTVALLIYWRRDLLQDDPYSDLARIVYKLIILTLPILAWHMWRSQIFTYLNFGDWITLSLSAVRRGLKSKDSTQFLGACLVLGLVTLAGAVLIGSLAIAILIAFSLGL